MNPNQPMNVSISLDQTKEVECKNCGGIVFKESMLLRKVPALLTGQARDMPMPIPVFRCEDCGDILREFLPPGLNLDNEDDKPQQPSSPILL